MLITVIEPYFEILTHFDSEVLKFLELAGRVCYKSEERITEGSAERFVRMIKSNRHESVLEHVSASVRFVGSRSMSHQLVRHRLGSYCLAGGTVVPAYKHKKNYSCKRWTLAHLYAMSQDPKRKGRLKLIRLRSLDRQGRLVPGRIKSIIYSGQQTVFRLTTKFGRQIEATAKHRFLTPNGWKQLSALCIGDDLLSNGIPAYQNYEWLKQHYLIQNKPRKIVAKLAGVSDSFLGKWLKKLDLQKPHSQYPNRKPGYGRKGMFSDIARARISERMSGSNSPHWRGDEASKNAGRLRALKMYNLPSGCIYCGASDVKLCRHHIDGSTHNNVAKNIMFLCEPCHMQWHIGQAVMSVFRDKIVSIELVGNKETYDIEMVGPNHNFVANGVVVHNSQESQRFISYSKKGFQVICPPKFELAPCAYYFNPLDSSKFFHDKSHTIPWPYEWFTDLNHRWLTNRAREYIEYCDYIAKGIPPEDARECLPNATKTEIVTTFNLRQWRHVFEERALNLHAQWQIRDLMRGVLIEFGKSLPAVFEDQVARLEP